MQRLFIRHSVAMLLILLCGFTLFSGNEPEIIKGRVFNKATRQPVYNAYVHTLAGEEETFTQKDGSFILKTWQALPVECTIEHKDFAATKVAVNKQKDTILIYLANK